MSNAQGFAVNWHLCPAAVLSLVYSLLILASPCEVDLSAGTSLAGLITHSSSLTSLALHNQALHPLGLSCMALAAGRSSSLTSLSLQGSAVGDQVGLGAVWS
jgi:hypothetical protein